MTENIRQVVQEALCLLRESTTEKVRYSINIDTEELKHLLCIAYSVRAFGASLSPSSESMISKVVPWIKGETAKNSLMLIGGVGCGKTTLANAICDVFFYSRKSALKAIETYISSLGYVSSVPKTDYDFLAALPAPTRVHAQKIADSSTDGYGIDEFKKCKLLFIDDLGCEPPAVKNFGTEITPATDIICSRYETGLPMIITTNLSMEMLEQRYGERISDRLKEMCDRVVFTNASFRN